MDLTSKPTKRSRTPSTTAHYTLAHKEGWAICQFLNSYLCTPQAEQIQVNYKDFQRNPCQNTHSTIFNKEISLVETNQYYAAEYFILTVIRSPETWYQKITDSNNAQFSPGEGECGHGRLREEAFSTPELPDYLPSPPGAQ